MEQQHIALSMIDDNSVWSRNGSYVQTGMHQRNAPIHIIILCKPKIGKETCQTFTFAIQLYTNII